MIEYQEKLDSMKVIREIWVQKKVQENVKLNYSHARI